MRELELYLVDLLDTIADLNKRQLAERDAVIEEARLLAERWRTEVSDKLQTEGIRAATVATMYCSDELLAILKMVKAGALDAYVQEKVDRAVLAESEWWHKRRVEDFTKHNAYLVHTCDTDIPECERLSANRAKAGKS